MFEEFIMWFYGSMALFVAALIWIFNIREKQTTRLFKPELICDGCGQVCSDLLAGYCEYCIKKY